MAEFEVYSDSAGDYRWVFRADNDEIVADSAEGYESKRACERGIEIVKTQAADADIRAIASNFPPLKLRRGAVFSGD